MYYLLYNPLSNLGKTETDILKLDKKLRKKGYKTYLVDLVKESHLAEIKAKLKEEDILVIAGGDGTLHKIANHPIFQDIKNEIYLYRCGRGNDFSRGHKGNLFKITEEIHNLPKAVTDNGEFHFLNGIGLGIDAYTCKKQMDNFYARVKESYFKIAWNAFRTFKPFSIDVTVDDKEYHYDKVWFFVVQNGKYFGGGMKISPTSVRLDEELEFYVIHNVDYKKLLAIFPLIFIGKHTMAKKYVSSIKGKEFNIKVDGYDIMQKDGEVETGVTNIRVTRH